jgi:hypothetical protein
VNDDTIILGEWFDHQSEERGKTTGTRLSFWSLSIKRINVCEKLLSLGWLVSIENAGKPQERGGRTTAVKA